jgi:hypothetical protein
MGSDDKRGWPDKRRAREFVDMVRARKPGQYVCFEYHDGESPLTAKALQKAIEWLVDSIQVLLAVDLEHSVVIASGVLSGMDEAMAGMIVDQGLDSFFWRMSKDYPNEVAMVKIDRKGGVTFDPSFYPSLRTPGSHERKVT